MPANTTPIHPVGGALGFGKLTSANNVYDGTGALGTAIINVFTSDATNGGRLDFIRARALGNNVQTVARIFLNNGVDNTVATNNTLFDEWTLPASSTSANAQTGAPNDIPMDIVLPAGWRVLVCLGTTVSAGWQFTGVGGKY
jgi:hypothetical protein